MRLLGGAQPVNLSNLYVYEHNINTLGFPGNDEAALRTFSETACNFVQLDKRVTRQK